MLAGGGLTYIFTNWLGDSTREDLKQLQRLYDDLSQTKMAIFVTTWLDGEITSSQVPLEFGVNLWFNHFGQLFETSVDQANSLVGQWLAAQRPVCQAMQWLYQGAC